MPKAVMLVFSDPADPAREAAYNEWYDGTHVPDVLKVAGITSATRFKLSSVDTGAPALPGGYLAVYEVEADDLADIPTNLAKAFVAGELPISDVIKVGPQVIFEQVSATQHSA